MGAARLLLAALALVGVAAAPDCEPPCVCPLSPHHLVCSGRPRQGLGAVRDLNLTGARFEPAWLADLRLPRLQRLALARNRVTQLGPLAAALAQAPLLRDLDLEHNELQALRPADLPPCPALRVLRLAANHLQHLEPAFFDATPGLEDLRLNKNRLAHIPKKLFRNLGSLRALDLNKNAIEQIDGLVFQNLTNLTRLKLRHNKIATISDGAFYGLKSITNLQLDDNQISSIFKRWMCGLDTLRLLSVSSNRLTEIEPGCWEWSGQLEELDLSDNRLTAINGTTFEHLGKLEKLNLDGNRISSISENAFAFVPKLKVLNVRRNEISWTVEDMRAPFAGLPNLARFSLAENHIKSVGEKAFTGLKALQVLDLSGNNITSLQERSFNPLTSLSELILNASSLLCDCDLLWFKERLSRLRNRDSVRAICAYPTRLRGIALLQLRPENFTCDDSPKPKIVRHPESQLGIKGGSATLLCEATSTGEANVVFLWRRNNVNVTNANIEEYAKEGKGATNYTSELNIKNINDADSGKYQCVASNRYGTTYSRKADVTTVIFPKFVKTPKNITVNAGETAKLECSANGRPMPQIAWHKDEGSVFPAAHERRMLMMANDDEFFIINSKVGDDGVYSCTAKNDAGSVVSNATLTVLERPSFVNAMENKETFIGESVVIECRISGSPKPTLRWLKDGAPIIRTERHFFTAEEQLLVIVNAIPADEGVYTCEIENSLGTVKDSAELKISSAPIIFNGDDDMMGIIIITVVCCAVGTSIIWVFIIYHTRKRMRKALPQCPQDSFQLARMPVQSDAGIQIFSDDISERSSCKDSGTGDSAKRSSLEMIPCEEQPRLNNSNLVSVYVNLMPALPGESRLLLNGDGLMYDDDDCDREASIQMHALDKIVPEIAPDRTYPYS